MRRSFGFTLIELVVVVVILGLLATMALPRLTDMSTNARIASVKQTMGAFSSALAMAKAQYEIQGRPLSLDFGNTGTHNLWFTQDGTTPWLWPTGGSPVTAVPVSQRNCADLFITLVGNSPSIEPISNWVEGDGFEYVATWGSGGCFFANVIGTPGFGMGTYLGFYYVFNGSSLKVPSGSVYPIIRGFEPLYPDESPLGF